MTPSAPKDCQRIWHRAARGNRPYPHEGAREDYVEPGQKVPCVSRPAQAMIRRTLMNGLPIPRTPRTAIRSPRLPAAAIGVMGTTVGGAAAGVATAAATGAAGGHGRRSGRHCHRCSGGCCHWRSGRGQMAEHYDRTVRRSVLTRTTTRRSRATTANTPTTTTRRRISLAARPAASCGGRSFDDVEGDLAGGLGSDQGSLARSWDA